MSFASILNGIPSSFASVLLVALDDSEIVGMLRSEKPTSTIRVITKNDIIGKTSRDIVKLVRLQQHDLAIVSNRFSEVHRPQIALELLAFVARAKSSYVLTRQSALVRVTLLRVLSHVPSLMWALVRAPILLLRANVALVQVRNRGRELKRTATPSLLFVRSDLAGSIRTGGSVSHVSGFINACTELGAKVTYAGDAPFPLHLSPSTEECICAPDGSLDVFDELQLLDYSFRLTRHLVSRFAQGKPELVYQRHAVLSLAGAILARRFRTPLFLEVNGSEVWAKKTWSRLILRRTAERLERVSFEAADRIFVVSEAVKRQIIPLGADEHRIVVNPNGVNPDIFRPSIDGSAVRQRYGITNEIVIGFAGTFLKAHGVETLLDALALLTQRNLDFRTLLIGSGPMKSELEMRVREGRLQHRVVFTGTVAHESMPETLAACDILVSPHIPFPDGTEIFFSPIKLFEYMAMGKAIVASNAEQIAAVLSDGETALLVTPGDPASLAEAIARLCEDKILRRKLGAAARSAVQENYAWSVNARRVMDEFQSL